MHHNHRRDALLTRSGAGTVWTYTHSTFGQLPGSVGADVCRFKFSSKDRDPFTGFSYYDYRFYANQW